MRGIDEPAALMKLSDTSAPFIVTLLIAAVGWLFDKSIGQFETTAFLYYSIQSENAAEGPASRITVRNNSLLKTLQNVVIVFECQSDSACFRSWPGASDENRYGEYIAIPPHRLTVTFEADTDAKFSQVRVSSIPVNSQLDFRYLAADKASPPAVLFSFPDTPDERVSVYTGTNLAALISANYYKVLLWLLVLLFVAGLLILISSLRKKPKEEQDETKHRVVLVLGSVHPPD